jgi:hypothetical protein
MPMIFKAMRLVLVSGAGHYFLTGITLKIARKSLRYHCDIPFSVVAICRLSGRTPIDCFFTVLKLVGCLERSIAVESGLSGDKPRIWI